MKRISILLASILLALTLVFSGCTSTTTTIPPGTQSTSSAPTAPATTSTVSSTVPPVTMTPISAGPLAAYEAVLEQIYAQVNPSVVNIGIVEMPTPATTIPGLPFSPPDQQFSQALGSGFVWDNQGNIVTNNHVVTNASSITVTFYDGTTVPGKVVGTDSDSDLAVINVQMPSLPISPIQMADSSQLKVGQLAIAIGNPFGLQGTMTTGIISGLGRILPTNQDAVGASYSIPDIIQTDAAINPGNSGGVLLDDTGKVIGVTSSIATTSGASAGVGFAIPAAIVQQVVPSLIKTGHYDHPYLGLSLITLDPDLATAMNLQASQRGALVETVVAGGPGDKAGLKASQKSVTINGQQINVGGDVIIAFNGQVVNSSDDLITFLARSGIIGQSITLTVLRGGQQTQVQVTLGTRPASQ
jgi:serine protease Do